MATVFLRLLAHDDKPAALAQAVDRLRDGEPSPDVHVVEPESFRQVPGAPFAYWVSEKVRRLFAELPAFESEGRKLRLGDHPSDDFAYLRLHWEVPVLGAEKRWPPYYKGCDNSAYYDETRLVVDWDFDRQTYRGFFGRKGRSSVRPSNYEYFFLAGLTFPNRPHLRGRFSHVPSGSVFGHTSPILQLPLEIHWSTCAILNSDVFLKFIQLLMARGMQGGQTLKYEVGYVRAVPIPTADSSDRELLESGAMASFTLSRKISTSDETSHVFQLPALLQVPDETLADRIAAWQSRLSDTDRQLAENQREIDDISFRLYRIDGEDRRAMEEGSVLKTEPNDEPDAEDDDSEDETGGTVEGKSLTTSLVSYSTGCVVGRWDIRFATVERPTPELPDPFDPLPVCSPGMLQGDDRLPLQQTPQGYPLRIDRDGILVDDPSHPDDIVRRVRDVLEVIWKERAEAIEREACEILGVKELREYFRRSGNGGFWLDHVSRYSKSRRKAPIYWLLQSPRKNYALWLYYHRLDKDILFKALNNYVEPKIRLEENALDALRAQKQASGEPGKGSKKLDKEIERQEDFVSELRDFTDKLGRAARLDFGDTEKLDSSVTYDPDLNDGVVLNIAPLHELVPWKEARTYWEALLKGEYDWSSIGQRLRAKGLVADRPTKK